MSSTDLVLAFEAINEQRRRDPQSLSHQDWYQWRRLLREIEDLLLVDPVTKAGKSWKFVKVPTTMGAQIQTDHGTEKHTLSLLGECGCFIPTNNPLEKGTILQLKLMPLRERYLISLPAKVAWTSPPLEHSEPGMALLFSEMTVKYQRFINRMIDRTVRLDILDNRTSLRTEMELPVRLNINNVEQIYHTANLSIGGMYIQSQTPPEKGRMIRADLPIPSENRIRCQVEVVHHIPYLGSTVRYDGFGVRFVDISNKDKQKIRSYLLELQRVHTQEE